MRKGIFCLLMGVIFVLPWRAQAQEAGTVTEDFGSTYRRQERGTFAFWDTKNREVSLPLQYTVELLPQGTALPTAPAPVKFAEVANRFSRVPAGRIKADALVAEAGNFTYALMSGFYGGLWVSLGQGIEVGMSRVSEFKDLEIKTMVADSAALMISGKRAGKEVMLRFKLQGFAPSSAAETVQIASTSQDRYFKKATLEVTADIPEGTSVEYMLSPDAGVHWEIVKPSVTHEFLNKGTDLRLRVILATANVQSTPYVRKAIINYLRAEVETPQKARERDNRRVSDLKDLANRLEKFKKERGVYPIVDDQYVRVRWNQLGQLLLDGKFISKMPQDPKNVEDPDRQYDYISSKGGNAYVLRARLDEEVSKHLAKDVDDEVVEPAAYEYTCDDPWYCEGRPAQIFALQKLQAGDFPAPTGTVPLLRSEDGRVFRVATTGGGSTPLVQRKLYIPKPAVISKLKNFYTRMQTVGKQEIQQYPRVRLVKLPDKDDIYYLTETWLKRRLPSRAVFDSYGNDLKEVVMVQPAELEAYGESRLIRLTGDRRVWYLEGGVKRLVRSPEIMKKRGFDFKLVSPVNFAEYNSYPEGAPLE